MNISDIKTHKDLVTYWRRCLDAPSEDDQATAYKMVGPVSLHNWDDLQKSDEQIEELFDLVANLETPIPRTETREESWKRVKDLLEQLEKRYT